MRILMWNSMYHSCHWHLSKKFTRRVCSILHSQQCDGHCTHGEFRFCDLQTLRNLRKAVALLQSTRQLMSLAMLRNTQLFCVGIGDKDEEAWICHHCASHLCSPQPRMLPQALAKYDSMVQAAAKLATELRRASFFAAFVFDIDAHVYLDAVSAIPVVPAIDSTQHLNIWTARRPDVH